MTGSSGAVKWDVIVAGAGPGGTATAIPLAKAGVRVLVLERDEFPRFHIGESLLPSAEQLVTKLGIKPDPNVFLYKRGAQFVCEETGRRQSFDFSGALPGPQRYAWQVDRARFDTILRDRAVDVGADVRHGIQVLDVECQEDRVRVRTNHGDQIARYFVDATGLDRLLARQLGSSRSFDRFGKAAIFTHFSGLGEAARAEFSPGNDIRIVIIPDGWLWAIPLTQDRLSVGLVSRLSGLRPARLDEYLETSLLFTRLLEGTTRGATKMIGNFSFENTASSGARYTCVGDSACFIDPIFSSGVSLAIARGLAVAEPLAAALEAGTEADPRLMTSVEESMKRGYDTFEALVYRFVDHLIFGAPEEGRLRAGVTSVLAGDVFRKDNDFQDILLQSRRHSIRTSAESNRQASALRSRQES
ncbi:MAG TPA: NAD(P)/FAD-dependent oxidoreductase [Myxococcales bacterium]|nr:NAD(P)/FAD-dependent oxidoreductase [Myxococcales bacterium]